MLKFTFVKEVNGLEVGYFYLPSSKDLKVMTFDNKKKKQTVISYESNIEGVEKAINQFLE